MVSGTQGPLGANSPKDAAHGAVVCFGQAEPFSQARLGALEATCFGLLAVGSVYVNTSCWTAEDQAYLANFECNYCSVCVFTVLMHFFHWKIKKTWEDTIERAPWDLRQASFRGPAANAPVPSEETSQLVVSEVILFVFSPCLCLPLGTLCKTLLLLLKGLSDSRAQQPGGQPAGEASDPVEPGRASRLAAPLGWLGEPASPLSKVFDWSSTFLRNILGFSKSALRVGASSCWKLSERASRKLWHRGCSRSGRPAFNSNTAVGLVSGQHTERGKFPGEKLLLV